LKGIKMLKKSIALSISLCFCGSLSAWEVDTHAWIMLKAFERSNLNPNGRAGDALVKRLGFDRLDPQAAYQIPGISLFAVGGRNKYFDLEGNWDQSISNPPIPSIAIRPVSDWEHSRFPESYRLNAAIGTLGPTPQLRLESWLMRGVVREDDLSTSEFISDPIPDADPRGDFTRVFGHFYDPINNDGIPDVPLFINEVKVKSINWALGLDDALSPSFNPTLSRRNHFTWLDARRAYFKALTYQTSAATTSTTADTLESETHCFCSRP